MEHSFSKGKNTLTKCVLVKIEMIEETILVDSALEICHLYLLLELMEVLQLMELSDLLLTVLDIHISINFMHKDKFNKK